jgi:CheY-like chemotaxis protein
VDGNADKLVLLVDDDEDIRDIVSEILADHGFSVRVAHNGREALRALDELSTPPRLILLDLMMPELDGTQFLAVLDEHPVHSGIPVVVVTASRKDAPRAVRDKVAGWLPKPVEYEDLVASVSRFVSGATPAPKPVTPLRRKPSQRDLGKFFERRHRELQTLQTALASSDHQEIRRIGHNLKGVGGSFGFPELTELGGRLENAARADDRELMGALVDELGDYVARLTGIPPADEPASEPPSL